MVVKISNTSEEEKSKNRKEKIPMKNRVWSMIEVGEPIPALIFLEKCSTFFRMYLMI